MTGPLPNGTVTEHYDFGGKRPSATMADEVWESFAGVLGRLECLQGVVAAGGSYRLLPEVIR